MNINLHYLYRDAANYKQFNYITFTNNSNLAISSIENAIRTQLIDGDWFVASKWNLPDLRPTNVDKEIDHDWHEFDKIEATTDVGTQGDIASFLQTIKKA